jgi:hypothetical protein
MKSICWIYGRQGRIFKSSVIDDDPLSPSPPAGQTRENGEFPMAYSLSSERPAMAAAQTNPVKALFGWLAKGRAVRAQRLALENLLEFDAAMLDDIGVTRQDLFDAMQTSRVGHTLAQRRAASARHWLNP